MSDPENTFPKTEILLDMTELAESMASGEFPSLNNNKLNDVESFVYVLLRGIEITRDARSRMAEIAPQLGSYAHYLVNAEATEVAIDPDATEQDNVKDRAIQDVVDTSNNVTQSQVLPEKETPEDDYATVKVAELFEENDPVRENEVEDTQEVVHAEQEEKADDTLGSPSVQADKNTQLEVEDKQNDSQTEQTEIVEEAIKNDMFEEAKTEPQALAIIEEPLPEEIQELNPEVQLMYRVFVNSEPGQLLQRSDFNNAGFVEAKQGIKNKGTLYQAFRAGIDKLSELGIAEKAGRYQYRRVIDEEIQDLKTEEKAQSVEAKDPQSSEKNTKTINPELEKWQKKVEGIKHRRRTKRTTVSEEDRLAEQKIVRDTVAFAQALGSWIVHYLEDKDDNEDKVTQVSKNIEQRIGVSRGEAKTAVKNLITAGLVHKGLSNKGSATVRTSEITEEERIKTKAQQDAEN